MKSALRNPSAGSPPSLTEQFVELRRLGNARNSHTLSHTSESGLQYPFIDLDASKVTWATNLGQKGSPCADPAPDIVPNEWHSLGLQQ
jgi:hypothetical protein